MDAASRKVTLTTTDGKSSSYKASPGVELRQFHVGEQIAVRVMNTVGTTVVVKYAVAVVVTTA